MPDNKGLALCAFFGVGIAVALYYAVNNSEDLPAVPKYQNEAHVMGMGVQASSALLSNGTPLDLRPEVHFWEPGMDPSTSPTKTVVNPHRYPAVPGGNVSTVMHMGWSQFCKHAPANDLWRTNPPEASVL